jgi:thiamine-phosphate pyrophosphorylase
MLHPHPELLRILDANANRAREGLRVLEDYARFALNHDTLTAQLKRLRHDLAAALAPLPMDQAILHRDTEGDVGTGIKTAAELTRTSSADLLAANAKRVTEALRSMEEAAKVFSPAAAQAIEKLRYRAYTIEQYLHQTQQYQNAVERFRAVRLYVLLTESLCPPVTSGSPWEAMLDKVLTAAAGVGAGQGGGRPSPLAIQLREKALPDGELLRRAAIVADRCREAGALAIINDRPDVALLANADGIHVGQTDLPCAAARGLLGPGGILGVSTERLEQARQAVADGATYVAVGPMFPTTTKEKPRLATPAYAAEAVAALPMTPVVAIGGITLQNLPELTAAGVRAVAVSAAVLKAEDPGEAVRGFLDALAG